MSEVGQTNTNPNASKISYSASGYRHPDTRVQFERFDSSSDDRREEKLVFKYIQRMEIGELQRHLIDTENKYDITEIYDKSGYSPLHFAAYKNSERIAEILMDFVSHMALIWYRYEGNTKRICLKSRKRQGY